MRKERNKTQKHTTKQQYYYKQFMWNNWLPAAVKVRK